MFVREGWRSKRTMAENIYTMWIEMTSVSFIYLNRIWGIPPEASPVHSKAAAWPLGFFTRTKAHTFVLVVRVQYNYMYESTKVLLSKVRKYESTFVLWKYESTKYESTFVLFLLPMHCHSPWLPYGHKISRCTRMCTISRCTTKTNLAPQRRT